MESIEEIDEDRRERFRHEARANTLRTPRPAEAADVAYTREDHAAWEASRGAGR